MIKLAKVALQNLGLTSKESLRNMFFVLASGMCARDEAGLNSNSLLVNGVLRTMDEFQDAFQCSASDAMAKKSADCPLHFFN